jgi:methyltransferase-like protein/2-polyprenyl-3-methyl-5-hydroxy-6-metoxy-1,4-benzoquinol methylase
MNPHDSHVKTSYDNVPYDSFPFLQTHPDRLATLGQLFGIQSPELRNCRVLEMGCAAGGNLIPMAVAMPAAQFVGVDLSAVQIAQGQRAIDELGIGNIRLLAMSITDVDSSFGQFDYVISHGVYSWVPNVVQEAMLAICAQLLSPNGVAYISYNTLPGWRMRGMVRDLMRYHALQFSDLTQQVPQARAILRFLRDSVPVENNAYGILLKAELESLSRSADYYIQHEHLEDINEPLYFHEFVDRASRHGLQYLAEADFDTMLTTNFPPEVQETVVRIAPDVIRQEQYMDFLRNRTFRQTLLVRNNLTVNRTLTPERVIPLWVSAKLTPLSQVPELATQKEEAFRATSGRGIKTPNPVTKAAIVVLARRWPETIAFSALLQEALALLNLSGAQAAQPGLSAEQTLASDLLQCYGVGIVELHAQPSAFDAKPGVFPVASPLARWQVSQGLQHVTTFRHETASIDPNLSRLLALLDGTRDRNAICREVASWDMVGQSVKKHGNELGKAVAVRVDQALEQLARSALLLA